MARKKAPRVRLPLRVDAAGSTLSVSWLDRATEAVVWTPDYASSAALTMWLDGNGHCGGFRLDCLKPKLAAEAVQDYRDRARFTPGDGGYSYLALIRKRAGRRFHSCVIFDGDTIVADVDKRGVPLGLEFSTAEVVAHKLFRGR
ncbi:MAG: hypothetical protein ACEQSX_16535 [Baekduiaceae bacterium]